MQGIIFLGTWGCCQPPALNLCMQITRGTLVAMWEMGTECSHSSCLLFQAENCCCKYIYLGLTGQPALQSNWTLSGWPAQGLMLIAGQMRELLLRPCPCPLSPALHLSLPANQKPSLHLLSSKLLFCVSNAMCLWDAWNVLQICWG